MVRIVLCSPRMRSTLAFVVVLAAVWAGTGGRAFAEKTIVGTQNVAVEPQPGVKVTQLRKGELLAPAAVPELDPNAAALALVLLAGSALMAADRRRVQRS